MPTVGAIILMALMLGVLAYDLYVRYFASTERQTAKIVSKRDPGIPGRKVYLVTVRTANKTLECGISKTAWMKAKPGEFAQITVSWKHRFVQRLEPLLLKPEEKCGSSGVWNRRCAYFRLDRDSIWQRRRGGIVLLA